MHDAGQHGPAPWTPTVAPTANAVLLTISNKLLFIANAAYPLHNVARVYTFVLRPRRWEAVVRFLKRVGSILSVVVLLTQLERLQAVGSGTDGGDGSTDPWVAFTWVVGSLALLGCLLALIAVLNAPSHFVLTIETNSAATALITTQDPQQLLMIARDIVSAIDNPQAELNVMVQSLTFKPEHYFFGDTVNMYGGSNNVGIKA